MKQRKHNEFLQQVHRTLFFADDVLILGEWSRHNIQGIVQILQCLQKVSGLTINLIKSNLFGVGISFADIQNSAMLTGCQALNFPSHTLVSQLILICLDVKAGIPSLRSLLASFLNGSLTCSPLVVDPPWLLWCLVLSVTTSSLCFPCLFKLINDWKLFDLSLLALNLSLIKKMEMEIC